MIELIPIALAAIAFAVLWLALSIALKITLDRLHTLRRNCFVTNEKGHRVRYVEASADVRARAEK